MASRRYFAAEMHFAIKTQETAKLTDQRSRKQDLNIKIIIKSQKNSITKRLPAYYRDKLDIVRFL